MDFARRCASRSSGVIACNLSNSAAIDWVRVDPAYLLFPGLALFAVTWGFNAAGDGLRDALDPRSVTRR